MYRLIIRLVCVVFLLSLVAASGCAKHVIPPMERPTGTLAVAGFTHPTYSWQLLAGYVSVEGREMDREILDQLDQSLVATLNAHGVIDYAPLANTRQCQEIVTFRDEGQRISALKYWVSVGRCMNVDWLLVPQVLNWQERVGDEWGSLKPASVSLDFYYIDVKAGEVRVRKHFEEVQLALSEDLASAGKFFDRGAKWITALMLAQEGIEIKLTELGL